MAQKPGPSASGCQCTGSLARNQAYWSQGWQPANTSFAVRSMAGASCVAFPMAANVDRVSVADLALSSPARRAAGDRRARRRRRLGPPGRAARPAGGRVDGPPPPDPRSRRPAVPRRRRRAARGQPGLRPAVAAEPGGRPAPPRCPPPTSASSAPTTTCSPSCPIASTASDGVVAIGAAGGDGTLSAAATIALEHGRVLVAVPSGTFNHLARDLGLDEPDDAVAAVRAGTVVRMDLGVVDADERRTFVNTLSFGGYAQVVDARERLQPRLGKWLALAVALARELPRMEPIDLELDGRRAPVWLGWIGNGRYAPEGFAPSWRERLDDGLLDVRLVLGDRRWARVRLVADVLAGRLQRSPVVPRAPRRVGRRRLPRRPAAPGRRRRDVRRAGPLHGHEAASRPRRRRATRGGRRRPRHRRTDAPTAAGRSAPGWWSHHRVRPDGPRYRRTTCHGTARASA